jgi:transposase
MPFETWSDRRSERAQGSLFLCADALPVSEGHPFYSRLNELLAHLDFDRRVEARCEPFYADGAGGGRPGLAPGVYLRMHLIGFFEGIDSERGIAWRVRDSLSLRGFLGYGLADATPDHSTLSRVRHRLDPDAHRWAFDLVLATLVKAGLVKGRDLGIDATTLEANAAMRSIVRRDTDQGYDDYLDALIRAEDGIEKPTRKDRAKKGRTRPKKGSNKDWQHPHDPDSRIAKMKDGSTHLAHKAEHVVDLEGDGAIVGLSLHHADQGDTSTGPGMGFTSLEDGFDHLSVAIETVNGDALPDGLARSVTEDAGYHSDAVLETLEPQNVRGYVCEPDRKGGRKWKGKSEAADRKRRLYNNRRRNRSDRGRRLHKARVELNERSNAHLYETGGMRRTHLRGHENILKRLIVHAAGLNLSILMRRLFGVGKPRMMRGGGGRPAGSLGRPAPPGDGPEGPESPTAGNDNPFTDLGTA